VPKTILIVDDNDSTSSVLNTIFSILYPDLNVVSFSTKTAGSLAVEWLKSNTTDYAILDVAINGVNGLDIYKTILSDNCDAKVIFLTGCHDGDLRIKKLKEFDSSVVIIRKVASIKTMVSALGLGDA